MQGLPYGTLREQLKFFDTSLRTRVRVADRGYANDLRAGAEGYAQYKFGILDLLSE
ncbi:MAG: hypothetical protein ACFKPT_24510 [Gloeotrichia echinulata GP01]